MGKYNELGERVAKALKDAGVKQRVAASELDLPKESLYRRMCGEVEWRVHELVRLAELAGISVGELLAEGRSLDGGG